jgi:flagellar motility protein MotE (MotC chaperone)
VAETILVLREQGKPADAAAVLRRLTDEEARDLVGRLMERKPERVDPQAWCAELLKRIEGRAVASETEEIRQRVAEAGQATQDEEELLRRFLEGKRRTHEKPAAAAKPPEPPPQPREETGF